MNADARPNSENTLRLSKLRAWFHKLDEKTEDDVTRTPRGLSLTVQIFTIMMWVIHDLGTTMGLFETPALRGMSIVFGLAFLIGVMRSIRLSNFFFLFTLNAIPFISVGILDDFSSEVFALSLIWTIWPLMFALFLLGYRETFVLVFCDFVGLTAFAIIDPDVSLNMLPLPFFLILGVSIITVLGVRERELIHSSIKQSESKYRQLIDLLPVGVVTTDHDERMISINPAMANLLGSDNLDLTSNNLLDFIPDELKETLLAERRLRRKGVISTYELSLKRKDGKSRHVNVYAAPKFSESSTFDGSVGVFLDITERKRLENIQKRQQHELELYTSLLRHDLKNDLGVIIGNTEILQLTLSEKDEVVVETIESIQAVCERMMNLLSALSTLKENVETDIMTLIKDTSLKAQEIDPDMTVNVVVDDSVKTILISGTKLLPMVFENLLRNASIHAGDNPEVEIRVQQSEDRIQILISDNGPGFPVELYDRLFQREVSSREGGGLGLYLAREVLETMGGSIDIIASPPGVGARFQMIIPFE